MKIGIIGLDSFSSYAAIELAEKGKDVLVIDRDVSKIESIGHKVTQAIHLSIIDEDSLKSIGLDEMDTVLVSMDKDFEDTILLTRIVKHHLKIRHVIARTETETKREILEMVGADQVILPEHAAAIEFTNQICSPFPHSMCINDEFSIIDIVAPREFIGKEVSQIDFEKDYLCKLIGIKRHDKITLGLNDVIEENDILYFAGKNKNLKSIFNL